MNITTANVINFYELDEQWQREAKSNLDDFAEETLYLEPDDDENPTEHVLWDLNECMISSGMYNGFKYNASINISNNSAMLLKFNNDMDEVEYIIV